MTPGLLEPLRHTILSAQRHADPALQALAVRRFQALDAALPDLPGPLRGLLERDIYRMLPSDWPLWVENCRAFNPARVH